MSALTLYAKASADFAAKLAETKAVLLSAAQTFSPLTQASSLGAEDMVITHLLGEVDIDCSVFVLDTGLLHAQTLALIGRIEARYARPVRVFRPQAEAASAFVSTHGDKAMYQSVALRKQCCGIRKMEPLGRALAGHKGWLTGLRREQSNARAEVDFIEHELVGLVELPERELVDVDRIDLLLRDADHPCDLDVMHPFVRRINQACRAENRQFAVALRKAGVVPEARSQRHQWWEGSVRVRKRAKDVVRRQLLERSAGARRETVRLRIGCARHRYGDGGRDCGDVDQPLHNSLHN